MELKLPIKLGKQTPSKNEKNKIKYNFSSFAKFFMEKFDDQTPPNKTCFLLQKISYINYVLKKKKKKKL